MIRQLMEEMHADLAVEMEELMVQKFVIKLPIVITQLVLVVVLTLKQDQLQIPVFLSAVTTFMILLLLPQKFVILLFLLIVLQAVQVVILAIMLMERADVIQTVVMEQRILVNHVIW